jgi:putative membrane protein
MKEQTFDWSVPQRQSPAAVFIVIAKAIMGLLKFLWPALLLYFFRSTTGKADKWEIILLLISGLTIVGALLDLLFFRFSVVNQELVIRKGFLMKKTLVLPLEKIQAVHIDKTWLHNVFNSAQVSFDSAGSEKMEIKISAISLQKAEALKAFISGRSEASRPEPDPVILSLELNDLMKLSFSANHLEAFMLLLAFGLSTFDNVEKLMGERTEGFWQWLNETTANSSAKLITFLVIAVLIISIVISVIRVLLVYMDFRVSRSEKGLHIRSGMINVKEKFVPFRKIQYVSWKANWVREKMNFYLMNFHSIGGVVRERQSIKVPVTRNEFIPMLVQHYHALLPTSEMVPLRVHTSYIARKTLVQGFIPAVLMGSLMYFSISLYALWFLLLIPLVAFQSWLFQRKFRLWANDEVLQIKKGVYGKEELILQWNKIQKVAHRQSIYQQRNGLATLRLFTAGGTVEIPFIGDRQAMRIMNYALYKTESSGDSWM